MGILELIIPDRVERQLRERSRSIGVSVEEVALEALCKGLGVTLDPAERAEVYLRTSETCFAEGEELLSEGKLANASEKLWGAAALMVKAVAAKRGMILRSHGSLHEFAVKLSLEQGDPSLRSLFAAASVLHQNLYESWLPEIAVRGYARDVRKLLEKLKSLIAG